jgi:hypothetical protein
MSDATMKRIHPMTRDVYEQLDDNQVRVVTTAGETGVFVVNVKTQPPTVSWVSGDLKHADGNMAIWVSSLRDFTSIR